MVESVAVLVHRQRVNHACWPRYVESVGVALVVLKIVFDGQKLIPIPLEGLLCSRQRDPKVAVDSSAMIRLNVRIRGKESNRSRS